MQFLLLIMATISILMAEIQQRPKKLALFQLSSHRIHFTDTLGHLKQVKFTLSIKIRIIILLHFFQTKKNGYSEIRLLRE